MHALPVGEYFCVRYVVSAVAVEIAHRPFTRLVSFAAFSLCYKFFSGFRYVVLDSDVAKVFVFHRAACSFAGLVQPVKALPVW